MELKRRKLYYWARWRDRLNKMTHLGLPEVWEATSGTWQGRIQKYCQLAGHPLRGWPARFRGHKGSGLWKVWTVPSPPLPPPLPCPPLPCPPLPSPPSPPSLPRTLFRVRPRSNLAALWITAETAVSRYWWARECGAARRSLSENEAKSAMFVRVLRIFFFWKRRITRAVIGMGTNEWPSPLPEG